MQKSNEIVQEEIEMDEMFVSDSDDDDDRDTNEESNIDEKEIIITYKKVPEGRTLHARC